MCCPLRVSLLVPVLATCVTIAVPPASAQGIQNKQIPAAIAPVPPAKALTPAPVPGSKYDCPVGYTKPELLLRVQNLRMCLPVGRTDARTASGPILTCGGRTGFYACGRNAMECCPKMQDNPCFSGAYACKADASQSGVNMVCCLR